jgi:hypothetical protein
MVIAMEFSDLNLFASIARYGVRSLALEEFVWTLSDAVQRASRRKGNWESILGQRDTQSSSGVAPISGETNGLAPVALFCSGR